MAFQEEGGEGRGRRAAEHNKSLRYNTLPWNGLYVCRDSPVRIEMPQRLVSP